MSAMGKRMESPIRVTVEVPGNEPFTFLKVWGNDHKLDPQSLHNVVTSALEDAYAVAQIYPVDQKL